MEKNYKKPLSIFLGCAIIPSIMTGCMKDTNSYVEESKSILDEPAIYSEPVVSKDKKDINTVKSLDELTSYLDEQSMSTYELLSVLERPEEHSVTSQIIASYYNLNLYGLSIEDVKEELHNILVFSQVPRCMSEEEYYFAVGKLVKTTLNNPFSVYRELAKVVHLTECHLEHNENMYGQFSCASLEQEYNDNYREIPIEEYLDDKLGDDSDYLYLKSKLSDGIDINEMVRELEIMVEFGLLPPTDVDVEFWYKSFHFLLSTLTEEESLFDRYIPLAMRVHNAMYPDDQLILGGDVNYLSRTRKIVK